MPLEFTWFTITLICISYGILTMVKDVKRSAIVLEDLCDHRLGCILPQNCKDGYYGPGCISQCRYPVFGKKCQYMCLFQLYECNHIIGCHNISEHHAGILILERDVRKCVIVLKICATTLTVAKDIEFVMMVTMARIAFPRVDIQTMDKNVSRNVHVVFRNVIISKDVKTKQEDVYLFRCICQETKIKEETLYLRKPISL